jgi:hypothetical protein
MATSVGAIFITGRGTPSISVERRSGLQQAAVKNTPAHFRNKLRPVLIGLRVYVALEYRPMSDQQLAVQAVRDAQLILEEYLEPRPHDHEGLLDRLVEVLERPSVMVAVDRLQRGVGQ